MLKMLTLTGLMLLALAAAAHSAHNERVLLRDMQVLTLHHGKWTTGRRTRPAPQLTCTGGTNRCKHLPPVVQCYNRGSDGQDIQWECKAVMDPNLRFNKIDVTCEGYDYPEDDYVLVGSCGLEYSIDAIDGKTPFPQPHFSRPDPRPHKSQKFSGSDDPGFGTILTLGIIASLMYLIYNHCVRPQHRSDSTAPPPPGFQPQYAPPPPPPPSAPPASDGPGFWSGMGLGGLAGYFTGRRSSAGPRMPTDFAGDDSGRNTEYMGRNTSSGWWGGTRRRTQPQPPPPPSPAADCAPQSESSVATGFGGTKRR